jgi:ubiquinone/menaquinone biosynthesis C-methylase UbiE
MSGNTEKLNYWKKIYLLDSFFKKILKKYRLDFFKTFEENIVYDNSSRILDVGTSEVINETDNLFIQLYKYKKNITCLSKQDLKKIKTKYKEINFIIGDALSSNLPDNSFDIVHSNATIEHVGDVSNQFVFLRECLRISQKFVFIQTPNKFFPIDFHTKIPLIHFLPDKIYRKLLSLIGLNFYANVNNLNLISLKEIDFFLKKLEYRNYKIIKKKLCGITSNLIIIIEK